MNALDLHFVAQLSVERLANCLAQGTVIALFAWLLLRMIGRRNSGTRFAVWFWALLAIAAVPTADTVLWVLPSRAEKSCGTVCTVLAVTQ